MEVLWAHCKGEDVESRFTPNKKRSGSDYQNGRQVLRIKVTLGPVLRA